MLADPLLTEKCVHLLGHVAHHRGHYVTIDIGCGADARMSEQFHNCTHLWLFHSSQCPIERSAVVMERRPGNREPVGRTHTASQYATSAWSIRMYAVAAWLCVNSEKCTETVLRGGITMYSV